MWVVVVNIKMFTCMMLIIVMTFVMIMAMKMFKIVILNYTTLIKFKLLL